MAGLQVFTFAVLLTVVVLVLSQSQTAADSPCPPDNPFCPVWVPCNYTEHKGAYCQDCTTRVICTPIGGLVRPCWIPGKKNCVDGKCVTNPSEECSPTEAPEETTTEDITTLFTEDITTEDISTTEEPLSSPAE